MKKFKTKIRLTALAVGSLFALSGLAACTPAATAAPGTAASTPAVETSDTVSETSAAAASSTTQPPEKPLTKLSLVLDWTPNTNHTGLYAAAKLGYYAEEGIELDIQQPPEGGAEMLVASGKADFAISFQDSIAPAYTAEHPLPLTAIAALVNHNTSGILSLKSKGISSPKGLEGKRYATWDLPVEKAILQNVIAKDGGDFAQVTLVPSTVTDVLSALQTNIDAVWVFYGWDGVAAQSAGLETNYWNFRDINPVFDYYSPTLVANDQFLKEQPELAKAFLRATAKGYEYAIQQPREAAKILLEATPELKAELVTASQEWLSQQYVADGKRWGEFDPARWNAFYAWLWENKLIEKEIPANTGFSNDFLP